MAGSLNQGLCTSFKVQVLDGVHNFNSSGGNVFKIALFAGVVSGTYGTSNTNYSDMGADEVSGTGYSAGGATLTNLGVSSGGTTSFTSFSNATWAASTISSSGAMIYNSTASGKAVAILAFGSVISSAASTFTVAFPSNDQNNAIIRLT